MMRKRSLLTIISEDTGGYCFSRRHLYLLHLCSGNFRVDSVNLVPDSGALISRFLQELCDRLAY